MATSTPTKRRIVIVGGGFGGVRTAAKLSQHGELAVTLISNHHTFAYYPQMYHSATGGSRSEVALMLTDLLGHLPVTLVTDTVTGLNAEAKTLTGSSGQTYEYDTLVLALGSVTNYFGIKGLQEHAFDIKTIDGAERFKRHIHRSILDSRARHHYVIVGGGPTGVELAGALDEYVERISRLHRLKSPKVSIDLVEAAPRLLPRSPEAVAAKVEERLKKLGVNVFTDTTVQAETADALQLAGRSIMTDTVVWTAGTANNPFFKDHQEVFTLVKPGKVQVEEHMQARPDVYVIGDNAAMPFSGLAETAINDANYVAKDIWRTFSRRPRPAYDQPKPSNVIPVGPRWASAQWKIFTFYGWPAWILRRLADLIGYADIERWPAAVRVWLKDYVHETGCRICDNGK
jgi:NADH:ubiquinone reductase (H+-translocating)